MKKINFVLLFVAFLSLFLSSKVVACNQVVSDGILTIPQQKLKMITVINKPNENHLRMIDPKLVKALADRINYCAEIQLSVKETYTATFGPDRANDIALGAFMGCMGLL